MTTTTLDPSSSRKSQDELIDTQRHVLLGSVSAMIAHEFNNLMTPVLARAQDAVQRDDVPAMRKALDCTVRQTERAIEVTRRLLALAHGDDGPTRVCLLRDVVDDAVISLVRPFEKDGITFNVDVPGELRVMAQPVLLEQVLVNLLLNARNAAQRGARIALRAARGADAVIIEVIDNGCGISRERIETQINPFLQANSREDPCARRDVGLGLNVCRLITQRHGATIEARANDDSGCTFRVSWPAAADIAGASPA